MPIRKTQLLGVRLFLVLLLGFSQAAGAATQFLDRARAWNKIPTIVVLGQEGDWRNQLVNDGVNFWNKQLAEIGSGFRLGPVTFVSEILPPRELAALSQATLDGERVLEPPPGLLEIEGDLIIALSDWAFVSFSMSFPKTDKRLIGIRSFQVPAFRFTNVGRNVIAHELGHAIGLRHNDDPSKLMCGRPATCRPDAFRSSVEHYFPLTEEEKQILLQLYPPTWK
jgi:hypothetical protein